jgi:glycosyltransferase involved in cell wall biosynthesis
MSRVEISIVIGTFNRKKMLINCIESIRRNGITVPYEMIVVDGGSDDGTPNWLFRQKDILTIVQHNRVTENGKASLRRSWGYFMNLGFKSAEGKYICMVSDDCWIHPGAIMYGYHLMEGDTEALIAGCAFPFRNSLIDNYFMVYRAFGDKILINHGLYRKSALQEIGWIDEKNFKFYLADSDLSLRIWEKGKTISVAMNAYVEHLHNEFDPMRVINRMEAEESGDFLRFKRLWVPRFRWSEDRPIIEKKVFDLPVPNRLDRYLPADVKGRFLLLDRWAKRHMGRDNRLYGLLKRMKHALFRVHE